MKIKVENQKLLYDLLKVDFEPVKGRSALHVPSFKHKETGEVLYIHNDEVHLSDTLANYLKSKSIKFKEL